MRTIAALILIAMTIALPVATMSVQHYHFHYGEDEEGRGLRNLGQLPPLKVTPEMLAVMRGQKRRLDGGKHNLFMGFNPLAKYPHRKHNGAWAARQAMYNVRGTRSYA